MLKRKKDKKKACSMSRQRHISSVPFGEVHYRASGKNLAYPCKNINMLLESKHAKKGDTKVDG